MAAAAASGGQTVGDVAYIRPAAPVPMKSGAMRMPAPTDFGRLRTMEAGEIVSFGTKVGWQNRDNIAELLFAGQNTAYTSPMQQPTFINWTWFPGVFTHTEASSRPDVKTVTVAPYMVLVTSDKITGVIDPNSGNMYEAGTTMQPLVINMTKVHIDMSYIIDTDDTMLAITAALNGVGLPINRELYMYIFPFVNKSDYYQRHQQFASQGVSARRVWMVSGPSLGLAIAAALSGLPGMMYTGFISQLGDRQVLTNTSTTGVGQAFVGANIVEQVSLVQFKAQWALSTKTPIVIPLSDQYRQSMKDVLERTGKQMLVYTRNGVTKPTFGAGWIAQQGTPRSQFAMDYSAAGYMFTMQNAIYTGQDIDRRVDFTNFGSYLLCAKSFSEVGLLAITAYCSIYGGTEKFIGEARDTALEAIATQAEVKVQNRARLLKAQKVDQKNKPKKAAGKKPKKPTKAMLKAQESQKKIQDILAGIAASAPTTRAQSLAPVSFKTAGEFESAGIRSAAGLTKQRAIETLIQEDPGLGALIAAARQERPLSAFEVQVLAQRGPGAQLARQRARQAVQEAQQIVQQEQLPQPIRKPSKSAKTYKPGQKIAGAKKGVDVAEGTAARLGKAVAARAKEREAAMSESRRVMEGVDEPDVYEQAMAQLEESAQRQADEDASQQALLAPVGQNAGRFQAANGKRSRNPYAGNAGFFDDVWGGIKSVGRVVGDVGEGALRAVDTAARLAAPIAKVASMF